MKNVARILSRWDAIAYGQLCAHAARLADENERLQQELNWAERDADMWRDTAQQMMEESDLRLAITPAGDVGVISAQEAPQAPVSSGR